MSPDTSLLANLTTLKVGGNAPVVFIDSEDTLASVVAELEANNQPWRVLGGGSNILAPDEGVADVVLKIDITGQTVQHEDDCVLLTVGAGEVLDDVVATTVKTGWWGIENLSHIPGSVGAVPVQNVGAYGVEAKDVVQSVRVFDTVAGTFTELSVTDCQFGYRDSVFKHQPGKHFIITAVTVLLSVAPNPQLSYRDLQQRFGAAQPTQAAIREAVIAIRAKKFPDWHTVGTAGSFFKNPIISNDHYSRLQVQYPELPGYQLPGDRVKVPLGWVLDNVLDLKGEGTDTVGLHDDQALVLINRGGATAEEITVFANQVIERVRTETDIEVEWEVTKW